MSLQFSRARASGAILAVACAVLVGGSTIAAPPEPWKAGEPVASVAPGTLPAGVTPAALPTYVPGTRWLVVNEWDATPLTVAAGGTLVSPVKAVTSACVLYAFGEPRASSARFVGFARPRPQSKRRLRGT